MAQRQSRFSLSQSQFSRRQKRRPRLKKLASIHLLVVAAALAITTIFYAIKLYYSHTQVANLDDNVIGSQHLPPAQNDQNEEEQRIEDDRDAPETGKREETLLHFYIFEIHHLSVHFSHAVIPNNLQINQLKSF